MSEHQRHRLVKTDRIDLGDEITDEAELERLSASRPSDDGVSAIVGQALSVVHGRLARGKTTNLVGGMLALVEYLEPAEMLELARALPALLSTEARAVFQGQAQADPAEKVPA
jgi:hypothetical protein